MIIFDIFGWAATIIGICMFAPQTLRVVKNRSADSLSKPGFLWFTFGVYGWIIYTQFVEAYPGLIANICIDLLMIPILYFIFINQKLYFILYTTISCLMVALGITLLFLDIQISDIGKFIFVILASSGTVFWIFPQIYIILKTKEINDYSLMAGILVMFNNILWFVYWIGIYATDSSPSSSMIISIITSAIGIVTQWPIFYIKIKNGRS